MQPISPILRRTAIILLVCCCSVSAGTLEATEPLAVCSPDGNHTASVCESGRISYRVAKDGAVEHTFYICNVQALAFSEDGKLLAAAGGPNGSQGKIKVWRIADRKQLCEIIVSGEGAKTLAVVRDGSLVVRASSGGRLEAWQISTGKLQWSRTLSSAPESIRFSLDGTHLLFQCADGVERVLVAANGRNLAQQESAKK